HGAVVDREGVTRLGCGLDAGRSRSIRLGIERAGRSDLKTERQQAIPAGGRDRTDAAHTLAEAELDIMPAGAEGQGAAAVGRVPERIAEHFAAVNLQLDAVVEAP